LYMYGPAMASHRDVPYLDLKLHTRSANSICANWNQNEKGVVPIEEKVERIVISAALCCALTV